MPFFADDDDAGNIPTDVEITVMDVMLEMIAKMTPEEQERYTQIFLDFYSHMYD